MRRPSVPRLAEAPGLRPFAGADAPGTGGPHVPRPERSRSPSRRGRGRSRREPSRRSAACAISSSTGAALRRRHRCGGSDVPQARGHIEGEPSGPPRAEREGDA
jgi:hypothetical protein